MKLRALVLLLTCLVTAVPAATLSERTYKKLSQIQELMGENKYREAQKRIEVLLPRVRKHRYEYAVVMQTYGYLHAAMNRYRKAVEAFEAALATETLPDEVQQNLRYNLAQLYAAIPDWRGAARAYEQWLATASNPSAESYAFGATIYAQLKNYAKAIPKIRKAIALAKKPRENWYQLLLAMYYERKQYRQAVGVLETMVALWPDRERYWKQLSGVHYSLGHTRKALAVMALTYRRGFLDTEKELMNLVNLYLLEKIPYKAARLMEKEMKAGRIRATGRHLQKLGEAWMLARETDAALEKLRAAAEVQEKGVLYLRLAQLYLDKEQWKKAAEAARRAIELGGLKHPGDAWLIAGMAYHELGKRKAALDAFRRASRDRKARRQARQWLNYLREEARQTG